MMKTRGVVMFVISYHFFSDLFCIVGLCKRGKCHEANEVDLRCQYVRYYIGNVRFCLPLASQ